MSTLVLLVCNKGYEICNMEHLHPLKREQLRRLLIPGYFVAVLIDILRGSKLVLFFKYF